MASFFITSSSVLPLLILSLPARSIILSILLDVVPSFLTIFKQKVKTQCDLLLLSLYSVAEVCRNLLANLNNLTASLKFEIETGLKSGTIRFPFEFSYIDKEGVESSKRLNICSLYISIIVRVSLREA